MVRPTGREVYVCLLVPLFPEGLWFLLVEREKKVQQQKKEGDDDHALPSALMRKGQRRLVDKETLAFCSFLSHVKRHLLLASSHDRSPPPPL